MSGCYCMILTGHPCSGKTTVAEKIKDRVTIYDPTIQVIIVQDHTNVATDNNDVNIIYGTNEMEKKSRGLLKNSFDRIVASNSNTSNKKTLVILDSMNYIKGYRYELYCIAKACGCYYSIVWCLTDVKNVYSWNESAATSTTTTRTTSQRYNPKLLQELILRYEPPDARNRWDRPLYKLQNHPTATSTTNPATATTTTTTTTAVSAIDQDVLAHSVYNMHNLADAMINSKSQLTTETNNNTTTTTTDTSQNRSTTTTTTKPKKLTASSTFKRSGNKKTISKPIQVNTPSTNETIQPSVQNSTEQITSLTAEALESLNFANKNRTNYGSIGGTFDNDDDSINDTGSNGILGDDRTTTTTYHQPKGSSKSQQSQGLSSIVIDLTTSIDEQIDCMIQSFFATTNKALSEGTSTRQHIATNSDVLQLVDTVTQQVCSIILSCQEENKNIIQSTSDGDETILLLPPLSNTNKDSIGNTSTTSTDNNNNNNERMKLRRPKTKPLYTSNDLRQLRNQYIQWCVKNPPENHSSYQSIAQQFVTYIEAQEI